MTTPLKDLLEYSLSLTGKALPFALSFVDDFFFLLLAKLDIKLPGLTWLGPTLFIITLLFTLTRWLMKRPSIHPPVPSQRYE